MEIEYKTDILNTKYLRRVLVLLSPEGDIVKRSDVKEDIGSFGLSWNDAWGEIRCRDYLGYQKMVIKCVSVFRMSV